MAFFGAEHDLTRSNARRTIPLDGTWEIAAGGMETVPEVFSRTVPVPGLVDMAEPAFEKPGSSVPLEERSKPWLRPADPLHEAFWYRREFTVSDSIPTVALLKIHKAKYGTRVYLNGHVIGEHTACFTPGYYSLRPFLKGEGKTNELLVRIGASLASLPASEPDGWDNEKARYIPGIYDRVELILTDTPHILNVQTVPDVERQSVRVVVEAANNGPAKKVRLNCRVREWKTGAPAGKQSSEPVQMERNGTETFELTIPLENCRLWSPEDPFLYTVEVSTGTDTYTTRFGMRSFSTDPESGRCLLNGKPYYLRGSNVCIFRFFEDTERGSLPWDEEWVRKLHRRFKGMHWNSLRYCIGFPPERWYEIADEEGLLIQDEFPVWYNHAKEGWPEAIRTEHLANAFTDWMRERWNHPCVVIWDAQNETWNDKVTAGAIQAVRHLDLSNRPWDNGWGAPQAEGDVTEYHPYRAGMDREKGTPFSLSVFEQESGVPNNGPWKDARPPFIINEYGWLWVNRDGSLPTLTRALYRDMIGEDASVEQRREYYARTLAAMTEFWRGRRKCAGVMHFCGLGYSRPNGQTSDNFIDVRALKFEPLFHRFVRDAFAPTGLMIDFWKDTIPADTEILEVPVVVINDPAEPWQGRVTLRLERNGMPLWKEERAAALPALGSQKLSFSVHVPPKPGDYRLIAALHQPDGTAVESLRDFTIPSESE